MKKLIQILIVCLVGTIFAGCGESELSVSAKKCVEFIDSEYESGKKHILKLSKNAEEQEHIKGLVRVAYSVYRQECESYSGPVGNSDFEKWFFDSTIPKIQDKLNAAGMPL